MKHETKSIQEILDDRVGIINANREYSNRMSFVEKISVRISEIVGTPAFLVSCFALATIPLIFPETMNVVQYISSGYLQLILLPILAIGSNYASKRAQIKAQADYEANAQFERETEQILKHLENHQDNIETLLNK